MRTRRFLISLYIVALLLAIFPVQAYADGGELRRPRRS